MSTERSTYAGFQLTKNQIRQDGYYWVKLQVSNFLVAHWMNFIHPGTGKWYGYWKIPGDGGNWVDSDFSFIGDSRLDPPAYDEI